MTNTLFEKIASDAIRLGYEQEMQEIEKSAAPFMGKALAWGAKNLVNPVKAFMKTPGAAFQPSTVRGIAKKPFAASLRKSIASEANPYVQKIRRSAYKNMVSSSAAFNREALKGGMIVGGGTLALGGTGLAIANRPRKVRIVE